MRWQRQKRPGTLRFRCITVLHATLIFLLVVRSGVSTLMLALSPPSSCLPTTYAFHCKRLLPYHPPTPHTHNHTQHSTCTLTLTHPHLLSTPPHTHTHTHTLTRTCAIPIDRVSSAHPPAARGRQRADTIRGSAHVQVLRCERGGRVWHSDPTSGQWTRGEAVSASLPDLFSFCGLPQFPSQHRPEEQEEECEPVEQQQ
jgi:hypothetical protein